MIIEIGVMSSRTLKIIAVVAVIVVVFSAFNTYLILDNIRVQEQITTQTKRINELETSLEESSSQNEQLEKLQGVLDAQEEQLNELQIAVSEVVVQDERIDAQEEQIGELASGSEVDVSIFSEVKFVDVTATSKGKGFAGGMKRHGFRGGRATHGCSISHRALGSTGQNQSPGKVFKGKKMAGHMGSVTKTQQNLEVVRVDEERNMILVKGSIPGSKGSDVMILPAVKKS